jgi:hypothetical protein
MQARCVPCSESAFYAFVGSSPREAALLLDDASLAVSYVMFQKNQAGRHGLVHVTGANNFSQLLLNSTQFSDNQALQYATLSRDNPEMPVYSSPQRLPVTTLSQPSGNNTANAPAPNATQAAGFLQRNAAWLHTNLQVQPLTAT